MANVSPDPNSGAAGTEWQTISSLRRAGCSVDEVWREDLTHRISHPNLYNLTELPITYRNTMLAKLQRGSYDVVQVNQPHGYLAARALVKHFPKVRFVHRSHGFEGRVQSDLKPWLARFDSDTRPSWRRKLSSMMQSSLQYSNRMIARYAHGHIVSASECKTFLMQHYGVQADRIEVIPQAPPELFHKIEPHSMDEKRMQKILYVGQFAFFKGPSVLAQAVESILRAVPGATFTWVCDQSHHASARELFTQTDVLGRVRLMDWMDQAELLKVYDAHGLFLFPSLFEGFGKAFLEAMARGLVVVAARNGGMRDIIINGTSGLLVPTGDSARMAERCIELLQRPDEMKRLSRAARKSSLQFTWDRVGTETINFYQRLIQSARE
jgi:glycosyltransferase involved in cell wall biosynthesis